MATNYLATTNLISVCEALITCKSAGLDLNTTFEAFKISSGNSFVHETEGQVILNGSRDINFTMDLVLKDIGLFDEIAKKNKIPLEISPLINQIFKDGQSKYGPREWSPNIIKRLEDATGISVLAPGFPSEIVDDEEPQEGFEVLPTALKRIIKKRVTKKATLQIYQQQILISYLLHLSRFHLHLCLVG